MSTFGRLDILGNVAGIGGGAHVTDVSEEAYRRLMAINVDAPFFLSQVAIPHLLEAGGCIINIASNAGLMGQAYMVAYCMSKGAVVQLTRVVAMQLGSDVLQRASAQYDLLGSKFDLRGDRQMRND